MDDKQCRLEVIDAEEVLDCRPARSGYSFGFIRLKSAAWTPHFSGPISVGEIVLDLGF
jgi:hypothetical protein